MRHLRHRSFCILHSAFCIALAALCAASASAAPADYIPLEYIESDGTTGSYLNTEYLPTSDTKVTVDMAYVSGGTTDFLPIWGYRRVAGTDMFALWIKKNTAAKLGYNYQKTDIQPDSGVSPGERFIARNDNARLYIARPGQDWKCLIDADDQTFTALSGWTITIFALRNSVNSVDHRAIRAKIYRFTIHEGGTLMRDYVPAKRISDDAVGLYDLVNDVFKGNIGRGAILAGPAVAPGLRISGAPVEYGEPTPAYGLYESPAASLLVSAPAVWTNKAGTVAAACAGWKLRDAFGQEVDAGAGNAFTYAHPAADAYRNLEWQWTRTFRVDAAAPADEGSATVSATWVADGASATFTATPAAGFAFAGWMNGAQRIVSRDPAFTTAITEPTTLRAVFSSTSARGWLYDGSGSTKTLTERDPPDGGPAWVLKCAPISNYPLKLSVTGVQTVGTNAVLNLRLPVADANGVEYVISEIGANAFKERNTITEVRLPDTVVTLGDYAFQNCRYITTVRLPANLKTINSRAFQYNVRLTAISPFLPDSVTTVGEAAFAGCERLALPVRVGCGLDDAGNPAATDMGQYAFKDTKIPSAYLGDGITVIPNQCFMSSNGAEWLRSVRLPTYLVTIGNDAFRNQYALKDIAPLFPATLTYLGSYAFSYTGTTDQPGVLGEVYIGTNGVPVTVGDGSFRFSSITKLVLGPGVSGPLPYQFCQECYVLEEVELSENITELGSQAFDVCKSLTSVRLPEGLTSIGNTCFHNCYALSDVTPLVPANCNYIGISAFSNTKVGGDLYFATNGIAASFGNDYAFNGTCITSAHLGDAITAIPQHTFLNCASLQSVHLPASLTSIGTEAFCNCENLTDAAPLFPAGCDTLGDRAFNGTKITGDVFFATNLPSATIGESALRYSHISSVVLGDAITTLKAQTFKECPLLASVRLPANLTSIGSSAFDSCSALTDVSPLLPVNCTSLGQYAFLHSPVTGDLYFATNGVAGSLANTSVFNDTRLSSATIGPGLPRLYAGTFSYVPTLRRLVLGSKPATIDTTPVEGIDAYQVAIVVPPSDSGWNTFVNTASSATKWENLTDAERAAYIANFPGEPYARALAKKPLANQWIVSYGMTPAGQRDVVVAGLPGDYAADEVAPAYGPHENIGAAPLALSAPQYAREPGTLYACAGYRIENASDAGWTGAVDYALADPASPAVSYDPAGDGQKRFSWLWNPVAYQVVVEDADNASLGSVTVTGADFEGYFSPGATATVTVVPAAGVSFVQWHGDVPEGHETDATLTIAMDGPKHLTPEFAASWVLAADGKTITDGYWTLNVTGTRNALVVGKPVETPAHGILDLRKPIECGGAFISFASYAFQDSTALKELRLPDTITSIGYMSFKNCTTLTTVDPLLPASVTYLRQECFTGCTALEGDLYLGTNGAPVSFESGSHFRYAKITSATLGDGVTTIPGRFLENCTSLGTVKMGEGVTSIGAYAFEGCSSLTTFEPLLPAALTKLYTQAFCNCPNLEGDLFIGTNGAPVSFPDGNNQFQFAAKITSATFGPGVSTIPGRFLESASSLRSVTFSEGLVEIGGYAFFTTPLTDIRLPETLTTIGAYAFKNCTSLTTVEPFLPASVTSLDTEAFCGCTALTGDLFLGTNGAPVRFPAGGSQFRYTEIGSATLGGGVTEIPGRMFEDCASLKRAHVSDSLTTINGYAFNNCSSLTNFTPLLPASIATVNYYAFSNCSALDGTVEVGGHRKSVTFQTDGHQFDGAGVTEVIIGPGLATVPGATFKNCARLKTITLDSITSLGNSVFGADTAVRDVYFIGDSVPTFGTAANNTSFQGWTAGQSRLHLPSGSAAWKAWADANATPWNALTDDDRDSFRDRWPTGKKPYARTKAKVVPEYQWVLGWTPSCGTVILLR